MYFQYFPFTLYTLDDGRTTYPLSEIDIDGVRKPIMDNYYFFEFNQQASGYKNNIIDGHVAPSYNSFSNIIILLLLLQVYLVYTNISTENFESSGKISKVTSSFIYLLGVLTAICSIILGTILKYYSTDGFANPLRD